MADNVTGAAAYPTAPDTSYLGYLNATNNNSGWNRFFGGRLGWQWATNTPSYEYESWVNQQNAAYDAAAQQNNREYSSDSARLARLTAAGLNRYYADGASPAAYQQPSFGNTSESGKLPTMQDALALGQQVLGLQKMKADTDNLATLGQGYALDNHIKSIQAGLQYANLSRIAYEMFGDDAGEFMAMIGNGIIPEYDTKHPETSLWSKMKDSPYAKMYQSKLKGQQLSNEQLDTIVKDILPENVKKAMSEAELAAFKEKMKKLNQGTSTAQSILGSLSDIARIVQIVSMFIPGGQGVAAAAGAVNLGTSVAANPLSGLTNP